MRLLFFFLLSLSTFDIYAQNTSSRFHHPDMLWTESDTFYVQGSTWDKSWKFATSLSRNH